MVNYSSKRQKRLSSFLLILSCIVLLPISSALSTLDTIRLRHLNNKKYIHVALNFITEEKISNNIYGFLPRQIAHIINQDDIENFKLSLSRGDWSYDLKFDEQREETTPKPKNENEISKYIFPSGAFLKAKKFDNFSKMSWKRFTNSLAGVTCSSLNQIDASTTGELGSTENSKFLFGQLPAEAICTENLTPWSKLLKTSRIYEKSLLKLIKPYRLAEAHYFGLSLEVSVQRLEQGLLLVKMEQSLSAVFKNDKFNTLGDLLGLPDKEKIYFNSPVKLDVLNSDKIGPWFDKDQGKFISMGLKLSFIQEKSLTKDLDLSQNLVIKRYLSSNGRGQLGSVVNFKAERICSPNSPTLASNSWTTLKITEILPWCISPFYSTFSEKISGKPPPNSSLNENLKTFPKNLIGWKTGKIGQKPFQINLEFHLFCGQTLEYSYEVENKLLGWTEYPADAERGIFISPGVVEVSSLDTPILEIYSPALIIDVPKPDFSMPFNALCLACTAVAILFGHIHNSITCPVELASSRNEKAIVRVFKKIKSKFMRRSDGGVDVDQKNDTDRGSPD